MATSGRDTHPTVPSARRMRIQSSPDCRIASRSFLLIWVRISPSSDGAPRTLSVFVTTRAAPITGSSTGFDTAAVAGSGGGGAETGGVLAQAAQTRNERWGMRSEGRFAYTGALLITRHS